MTDREQMILTTALSALAEVDGPVTEAMLHALVQGKLGARVTVSEMDAAIAYVDKEKLASGLPGALGHRRWMITDKGHHTLSQLNR
jgi:hypothetical protein